MLAAPVSAMPLKRRGVYKWMREGAAAISHQRSKEALGHEENRNKALFPLDERKAQRIYLFFSPPQKETRAYSNIPQAQAVLSAPQSSLSLFKCCGFFKGKECLRRAPPSPNLRAPNATWKSRYESECSGYFLFLFFSCVLFRFPCHQFSGRRCKVRGEAICLFSRVT